MLNLLSVRSRINILAGLALVSCIGLALITFFSNKYAVSLRDQTAIYTQRADYARHSETELLKLSSLAYGYLDNPEKSLEDTFVKRSDDLLRAFRLQSDIVATDTAQRIYVRAQHFVGVLNEMISLRQQIGLSETLGLEGHLREAVHGVENRLEDFGDEELTVKMLMMRRHEKDFMMRVRSEYIAAHSARASEFLNVLDSRNYSSADKRELKDLVLSYQKGFQQWADKRLELEQVNQQAEATFDELSLLLAHCTQTALAEAAAEQQRLDAMLEKVVFYTIGLMCLFGAVCLGITWAVGNSISKPIRKVAHDMLAICAGRSGAEKTFDGSNRNEIVHLQNVLAYFRESLADADRLNDEVRYHRDHLEEEVAKQTQLLNEKREMLEQALSQEKELNALQSQFVSAVSHEFRTPLTIIDAMARRVMNKYDTMSKEDVFDRMQSIRSATGRLSQMVEQTLDSSKIAQGRFDFSPAPTDIAALAKDIVHRHREIAPDFTFDLQFDAEHMEIESDERLLDHVIANLISNAIKYSQKNPYVIVRLTQQDDEVTLSVRDHGVGIPASEIPMITKRFFRASTSEGIKGTGIGLNLASKLIEVHDGHMEITSVEGEWTEFTVTLPLRQVRQDLTLRKNEDAKLRA